MARVAGGHRANLELVRRLRPRYKLSVLSNADMSLRGRLERDGLHALFDDVVVSAEVGMAKPDPAIFRLAADRLGLPPAACVFVDDWDDNVEAARAVGMRGVLHRVDKGDDLSEQLLALGVATDGIAMARTALFLNPGADLGAALALAQRADALGYESLWVTHGIGRDALLTLSAYAHVAPRAGLGTGVIPIYPRHPGAPRPGGAHARRDLAWPAAPGHRREPRALMAGARSASTWAGRSTSCAST